MENEEFYPTLQAGPWVVGSETRDLEGPGGPGDICVALDLGLSLRTLILPSSHPCKEHPDNRERIKENIFSPEAISFHDTG